MSTYYSFIGLPIDLHLSEHNREDPWKFSPHIEPYNYCPYCFPANENSDRRFVNFLTWTQDYHVVSYNKLSQELFDNIVQQNLTPNQLRREIIKLLNTFVFGIKITVEQQTYLVNSVLSVLEETDNFETPSTNQPTESEYESSSSEDPKEPTVTIEQIQSQKPQPKEEITMSDGMDSLIQALGELTRSMRVQRMEKILIPIRKFKGNDQDPVEWLHDFEVATKANRITNERKIEIVRGYLEGPAAAWFDQRAINNDLKLDTWENEDHDEHDFTRQFILKFCSPRKMQQWQD